MSYSSSTYVVSTIKAFFECLLLAPQSTSTGTGWAGIYFVDSDGSRGFSHPCLMEKCVLLLRLPLGFDNRSWYARFGDQCWKCPANWSWGIDVTAIMLLTWMPVNFGITFFFNFLITAAISKLRENSFIFNSSNSKLLTSLLLISPSAFKWIHYE